MKNITLFVFSGTGNTKRLAELYGKEFAANSVNVNLIEVTSSAQIPTVDDADAVGIFYPIHAFNAPIIVLDFADKLPKTNDKPLFIVKTSGEPLRLNNISSGKLLRKLSKKGYRLFSEYHYAMPYNMIFRHSDFTATKMWDVAKALAPIEAREVLQGKKHILSKIPFGRLIAFTFRIEHPAMKVNGRFFKVDYDKCVLCGKCARECPTHNIKMQDGKLKFGGDCTCCVRCSFNCPKNAIDIALLNSWKINGAYDMENHDAVDDGRHKRYCRRAYEKYFNDAQNKINGQPT